MVWIFNYIYTLYQLNSYNPRTPCACCIQPDFRTRKCANIAYVHYFCAIALRIPPIERRLENWKILILFLRGQNVFQLNTNQAKRNTKDN